MTAIFSKCRLLFSRQIMNFTYNDSKMIKSCYISLCPLPTTRLKNKNVYKNCATLKTKKRRKQKIIFSPQFFFVPKSCGAIIFSCGIISTPLISQIFCVLDKEKELISFFSKQHFQIEKKIYKLISTTTQQNQFRGISTKMMEKQKRKKFKK